MISGIALLKALKHIERVRGEVDLFAAVLRADTHSWDLVVSADWLEAGKLKATGQLVELLADSLGENALRDFSRIAALPASNPIVKQLRRLDVEDLDITVRGTDLMGIAIEEALVVKARPEHTGRPKRQSQVAASR